MWARRTKCSGVWLEKERAVRALDPPQVTSGTCLLEEGEPGAWEHGRAFYERMHVESDAEL